MITSVDLQFFGVVARASSLAAAARVLDVTPSAVTQRLQDLERRTGARLVERSGRRITLTAEGELLASRGRAIVADLAAVSDEIASRRGVVRGHLRVVAPLGFGRAWVGPIAAEFALAYPDVHLDLVLADRLGAIPDVAWDIAIHIGEARETPFTALPIAPNGRVLCASAEFVARYGAPTAPADLMALPCVALRENDEDVTMWRFSRSGGAATQVRITPRYTSNDGEVVRQWGIAGLGAIVRSEWAAAADLVAGRLVRLLPGYELPPADIVAFVSRDGDRPARTDAFLHHLRSGLDPAPWRSRPLQRD